MAERGGRRAEAFSEAAAEMAIKGAVTVEEGKKEAHKEEREKIGAPANSKLNSLEKSIEEMERRGRRRIPALSSAGEGEVRRGGLRRVRVSMRLQWAVYYHVKIMSLTALIS